VTTDHPSGLPTSQTPHKNSRAMTNPNPDFGTIGVFKFKTNTARKPITLEKSREEGLYPSPGHPVKRPLTHQDTTTKNICLETERDLDDLHKVISNIAAHRPPMNAEEKVNDLRFQLNLMQKDLDGYQADYTDHLRTIVTLRQKNQDLLKKNQSLQRQLEKALDKQASRSLQTGQQEHQHGAGDHLKNEQQLRDCMGTITQLTTDLRKSERRHRTLQEQHQSLQLKRNSEIGDLQR